jgi:iron(III) transport system substrate-binding protein
MFQRLLAAACLVLSCAAAAQTNLATYTGADREQRLHEAAKKEGSLLFYTTTPTEYVKDLIEPFEKRYGIKVNIWRARSEAILQRVVGEARGGRPIVDVIHSISPPMEALHREGLLQPVNSPYHKDLTLAAVPAHHAWASTLQYVFVQAYNTQKVTKDELPRTYQDLLHPRWKGRLGIESSDHEWMTSVISDMGEDAGLRFFRELVRGNGLSVRTGHPLLTNLTASGEMPLALTVYQYSVEQAKKKGSPIEWFVIEPAVAIADGIAVAKKAPSPNAALLFYDYMLSPDAQRVVAKIGYVPTSTRVEPPLKGVQLKTLNPAALLDAQEKSQARFDAVLQGK